MNSINEIEKKIEALRQRMYELYHADPSNENLLTISQELDHLLNQLDQFIDSRQAKAWNDHSNNDY
ncbi:aspartyl-phosphate phosphatase Spo0E family protein [Thalassobacillus sp. CUG 92003]|uniref:aspartyl-phosphate phosphatase Spo0E family protein n=1 Tax=Thalassobacillus sp. CUG 92003 TaxID=2736641 RepID=UPI0015E7C28E|nr:aspartyl-phosphate phosphatase Spo0E family protein [Thalassobacillus sp. CUG 92003]